MVDYEVDSKSVKKVEKALKNAVRSGTKDARDNLVNVGQRHAKDVILRRDAIWKGELYRSIKTSKNFSGRYAYKGQIFSTSSHAPPVEHGAQYTTRGPPLSALIPWVKSKVFGRGNDPTGSSGVAYAPEVEEGEIGGSGTKGDVVDQTDVDTTKGRFYRGDGFDADDEDRHFIGQEIVVWSDDEDEYIEGEITGFGQLGPEMQYTDSSGETSERVTPSPLDDDMIVFAEEYFELTEGEKQGLAEEIYVNEVTTDIQSGSDFLAFSSPIQDGIATTDASIENEEYRQALVTGLSRTDRFTDTPKSQTTARGYHSPGAFGTEEIYINPSPDADQRTSTSIHEVKHLIDHQFDLDIHSDVKDDSLGGKATENRHKSDGVPLRFEYMDDWGGDTSDADGYSDAQNYFLGVNSSERGDQLDHFGERMKMEVEQGSIGGDTFDYESLSRDEAIEKLGPDGDRSAGDYLKTEIAGEEKIMRVESTHEAQDLDTQVTVVSDQEGKRHRIQSVDGDTRGGIGIQTEEGILEETNIDVEYYERDTEGRSVLEFDSDEPIEQYHEAINRAWLRQALASEEHSDEDVRARYYMGKRYSATGAHETSSTSWQMFLSDDYVTKDESSPADMYQNHPDLFYAMNQIADPSEEFKEEASEAYGVRYETLVERAEP